MELIDSIRQIAKVYTERKELIQTEEATKKCTYNAIYKRTWL